MLLVLLAKQKNRKLKNNLDSFPDALSPFANQGWSFLSPWTQRRKVCLLVGQFVSWWVCHLVCLRVCLAVLLRSPQGVSKHDRLAENPSQVTRNASQTLTAVFDSAQTDSEKNGILIGDSRFQTIALSNTFRFNTTASDNLIQVLSICRINKRLSQMTLYVLLHLAKPAET